MEREKVKSSLPLRDLRIDDAFWNRYLELVTGEMLPYQYRALNDLVEDAPKSHSVENLRIAAGELEGDFHGWVFQDSDLAKFLEAAAYTLAYAPDPELEAKIDELIELVARAQEENGYLDTYFTIKYPGQQFCNLKEGHELYTMGHFIEAAVAYYQVTGKRRFLELMCACADNIVRVMHSEGYEDAVPGHEEIELALMRLWEATGNESYAQMAKEFVDRRGKNGGEYLASEHLRPRFIDVWHDPNPYDPRYGQAHKPVREQDTAEGHAVRALYLYAGVADVAERFRDRELLAACERVYQNIVTRRMYVTGGIGSSHRGERFSADYDLPNDTAYCESCASIALALFCRRMAKITGDAKYMDTCELALMNTVLAGLSLDGKRFFYVNPLETSPREWGIPGTDKEYLLAERQPWFGCACCPPNIARTLASLGEYLFFSDGQDLWVNMYVSGHYRVGGGMLTVRSNLPYEGKVELRMGEEAGPGGVMHLRLPDYAEEPCITVNGEPVALAPVKGYQPVKLSEGGTTVILTFQVPPRLIYANPRVAEDVGKCCVKKGPLIYCMEEIYNGVDLAALMLDPVQPLEDREEGVIEGKGYRVELESPCEKLYTATPPRASPVTIRFTPYCTWGNRGPEEMRVWVRYR